MFTTVCYTILKDVERKRSLTFLYVDKQGYSSSATTSRRSSSDGTGTTVVRVRDKTSEYITNRYVLTTTRDSCCHAHVDYSSHGRLSPEPLVFLMLLLVLLTT